MLVNTLVAQSHDLKARNKIREVYMGKETLALIRVRGDTHLPAEPPPPSL